MNLPKIKQATQDLYTEVIRITGNRFDVLVNIEAPFHQASIDIFNPLNNAEYITFQYEKGFFKMFLNGTSDVNFLINISLLLAELNEKIKKYNLVFSALFSEYTKYKTYSGNNKTSFFYKKTKTDATN